MKLENLEVAIERDTMLSMEVGKRLRRLKQIQRMLRDGDIDDAGAEAKVAEVTGAMTEAVTAQVEKVAEVHEATEKLLTARQEMAKAVKEAKEKVK